MQSEKICGENVCPYPLCELGPQVVDLVHDGVVEPRPRGHLDHPGVQEAPLRLPVVALRGGDAALALLEEGAGVYPGAAGELLAGEGVLKEKKAFAIQYFLRFRLKQ